jgi:hypothetical protein
MKEIIINKKRITISLQDIRTLFLLVLLMQMTSSIFGQNIKTVFFNRCYISIYQRPIMLPSGKWDAIYENLGWSDYQGKITIDEAKKTIQIIYSIGETRTIKNIKKEVVGSFMDEKGVVETTYRGIYTSDLIEAKLVITETKFSECTIKYYSNRIIDTGIMISGKEVKFDDFECFKNIVLFSTNKKCFE